MPQSLKCDLALLGVHPEEKITEMAAGIKWLDIIRSDFFPNVFDKRRRGGRTNIQSVRSKGNRGYWRAGIRLSDPMQETC